MSYLDCVIISGATDKKTHGSDHTTDFESQIIFWISKKKFAFNILLKVYFKYFYIPPEATVLTT